MDMPDPAEASIRVVPYEARWRNDFARLNEAWLRKYFRIEPIDAEVLGDPGEIGGAGTTAIMGAPLREARETFEREYLRVQIGRFSGNISRTASFIGMERSALHRKLKLLGITETRED